MDLEEKIEILHDVAAQIGGELWNNYSGRFMYGLKCYGIVCDEPLRCIEHAAVHGITGASYDNMGLQYVVYWPRIRPDPKSTSKNNRRSRHLKSLSSIEK